MSAEVSCCCFNLKWQQKPFEMKRTLGLVADWCNKTDILTQITYGIYENQVNYS